MRTGLFHHDSVPFEDGGRLAQFVAGTVEPVTPAAAYSVWAAAGESESAAAARQRMIDRHERKAHSTTAAEGRERMIQRGGNGNGEA